MLMEEPHTAMIDVCAIGTKHQAIVLAGHQVAVYVGWPCDADGRMEYYMSQAVASVQRGPSFGLK